jgi:protein dithiol oxidoreductase (disulfide-forming)
LARPSANPGYKSINPPHADRRTADKIEVVEVFWYGCPHCYDFEPYLDAWLETKPDDVDFKRMPGIFRQDWLVHARAFYAAEQLGVLDDCTADVQPDAPARQAPEFGTRSCGSCSCRRASRRCFQ